MTRCRHRAFLWSCGSCRRATRNLHLHVSGERERQTLRLLAAQARLRDDEGEGYDAPDAA